MNIENIEIMPYADFVGFIGQHNTPPGGLQTIKKWISLSEIKEDSNVLDFACSTGFSSRETVGVTSCTASGFDISEEAILSAQKYSSEDDKLKKIGYSVMDASKLEYQDDIFTHILAGCTFGFIGEREKALSECSRVLLDNGKLCVANFYYTERPDQSLLDAVSKVVNFKPNPDWTRDWWVDFFSKKFTLVKEEDHSLNILSKIELESTIEKFIYQDSFVLKDYDGKFKKACFNKLLGVRTILNEHRKYQKFNITVWANK